MGILRFFYRICLYSGVELACFNYTLDGTEWHKLPIRHVLKDDTKYYYLQCDCNAHNRETQPSGLVDKTGVVYCKQNQQHPFNKVRTVLSVKELFFTPITGVSTVLSVNTNTLYQRLLRKCSTLVNKHIGLVIVIQGLEKFINDAYIHKYSPSQFQPFTITVYVYITVYCFKCCNLFILNSSCDNGSDEDSI